ncbi:MAG: hypothetical protein TR69_WS6001000229 [candidate division WS6 bacterium OLB20]|uniref:Uncharacterized protein n=1 Tax=candidate division WS6 bacterium OLB20 TaxID=1617426 RepID=A0A136M0D1_9BACT|nr:MAG: hypothetical protein TR69_WS6001000229 [candidate division WS6 bacterium OLB20]
MLDNIIRSLKAQWVVCKTISDRRSVLYGIRFSYPLYIVIVFLGTATENPVILLIAALIALGGRLLPLHPLDYVYNAFVPALTGAAKIPGRGSELQVSSMIALLFIFLTITIKVLQIPFNFSVLAILYVLSSVFFIVRFLAGSGPRNRP